MSHPTSSAVCARLAAEHRGVVSRELARRAGLSADAFDRVVTRDGLRRVLPTVYALWTPHRRTERWLQRVTAATLWCDAAAVSHRAAALLFDLDGVKGAPVELTTTGSKRSPRPWLIVHRVARRPEVVVRDGLPVTHPARTLLDLAGLVDDRTLTLAFESAIRKHLTNFDEVVATVQASPPTTPGRGGLRRLVERGDRVTDSALEVLLEEILLEHGLPQPVRQFPVCGRSGGMVARIDLAYPAERLAIEADGVRFHSSGDAVARDRRRQNALIAAGWTVYRVTWRDLTSNPLTLVQDVGSLLSRARHDAKRGT